MISQELIDELRVIMQEDHDLRLNHSEATEVAEFLTSYFEYLTKMKNKNRDKHYAKQTNASLKNI